MIRLKPHVSAIGDSKQGNLDMDSPWAKARLGWVTQLLIRFGVLDVDKVCVPRFFDIHSIGGPLELSQIAFWDETHKKQVIGGAGHDGRGSRVQFRFLRNKTSQTG